jgi:D-3-phosphoglycerate dehydrogenase
MDGKGVNSGMKALITARLSPSAEEVLAGWFDDIQYAGWRETHKRMSEEELLAAIQDVDVFITEFAPVTARVLAAAPRLRVMACGRNEPAASVDLKAATQHGIPVLFPPGRNAISVAEFTFGLMISLARHIATTDYLLKKTDQLTVGGYVSRKSGGRQVISEWSLDPGAPFLRFAGPELFSKTLGLIGFGTIGRAVARIAHGFQMRLLVYDPYITASALTEFGAIGVDLKTLLQEADFVSLHCKVTPETQGLIGESELSLMKPTAYLINTARAAVVDYAALHTALTEGRIAGAALDVYEREPVPPDDPLLRLDNVLLTPHLAGAAWDIPNHHSEMLIRDLTLYFAGRRPEHLANPEVWETRRRV